MFGQNFGQCFSKSMRPGAPRKLHLRPCERVRRRERESESERHIERERELNLNRNRWADGVRGPNRKAGIRHFAERMRPPPSSAFLAKRHSSREGGGDVH